MRHIHTKSIFRLRKILIRLHCLCGAASALVLLLLVNGVTNNLFKSCLLFSFTIVNTAIALSLFYVLKRLAVVDVLRTKKKKKKNVRAVLRSLYMYCVCDIIILDDTRVQSYTCTHIYAHTRIHLSPYTQCMPNEAAAISFWNGKNIRKFVLRWWTTSVTITARMILFFFLFVFIWIHSCWDSICFFVFLLSSI